mmetsp:Transcript_66662/g.171619  ORF Transcript_66662/g.171619 Transcript_66662/m.171619 type:complete len:236 (-) Transcript_66662:240-947(-)
MQHGQRQLLLGNRHVVVAEGAGHLEGVRADRRHRQAVGERAHGRGEHGLACGQCRRVAWAGIGLNADDRGARLQRLHREADAREEADAAGGHQHVVDLGQLLDDLESHGAGAGDDLRVVIAVDVAQPVIRGLTFCEGLRLADVAAVDHHVDAEAAAPLDLGQRRHRRHEDGDGNAQLHAVPCQRQRVVPGGSRHHACRLLLFIQGQQLIPRASLLKGPCELRLLVLEVDLGSRHL